MKNYEYKVTVHDTASFSNLVFFCSDTGECGLEDVQDSQTTVLEKILNQRGSLGWELVHMALGKNGLLAVWKRPVTGASPV